MTGPWTVVRSSGCSLETRSDPGKGARAAVWRALGDWQWSVYGPTGARIAGSNEVSRDEAKAAADAILGAPEVPPASVGPTPREHTMRAALDPLLRHEADGILVLADWTGPAGAPELVWTVLRVEPSGRLSGHRGLTQATAEGLIASLQVSREPTDAIVRSYLREIRRLMDLGVLRDGSSGGAS